MNTMWKIIIQPKILQGYLLSIQEGSPAKSQQLVEKRKRWGIYYCTIGKEAAYIYLF